MSRAPLTREQIEEVASSRGIGLRAPRLAALVEFIERELGDLYRVHVDESWYTPTGPTLASGVRVGDCKGRKSTNIEVYDRKPRTGYGAVYPTFTHRSGQTYACNRDVCMWIAEALKTHNRTGVDNHAKS